MDGTQFDQVLRRVTAHASRRGLLGGVLGVVAGLVTGEVLPLDSAQAKKGGKGKGKGRGKGKRKGKGKGRGKGKGHRKVLICHKGQEIMVGEPAVAAHVRNHGDTIGPCPPPNPCAGRPDDEACTLSGGGTGACCGGVCTPLNTLEHCTSCADVCRASTDTCAALGSGGDPASGCCASVGSVCTPVDDQCCGDSTCTGSFNGQTVCCGIAGVSSCTEGSQCCSGTCTGGTCA